MLHTLRALRSWPFWFRLVLTGATLGVFGALQLPLETEVPGDPFLLFAMVVIGSTLTFGERVGFFAVALSTFLSFFFFEPLGTLAITHAADLIKIELYAVLASACVLAVAQVDRALVGALAATQSLKQSDKTRSILLRELAHRVANNFAVVATLIRTKAASVSDPQAKLVLNEAIEQVTVMARLHRLLHADDEVPTIDSERFIAELCQDLETSMACARPISIQSVAVSRQLPVAQAVPMGLIVNELITNAIKHAFPGGRSGTVCVSLGEEDEHRLRLTIEDDGVGFRQPKSSGMGQRLVAALAEQLGGRFESKVTAYGCSFSVAFPYADPPPTTRPSLSEQMAH